MAINIILDERKQRSGEEPTVAFVEIELDNGRSINIGERLKAGIFTKIRITAEDILEAEDTRVMRPEGG